MGNHEKNEKPCNRRTRCSNEYIWWGKSEHGFILAELLIVVAIIAVLVAISIPIFTSQLEKSRRAVDLSNARNMKSILMNSYASGSIQFPNATETTYVAAIVKKDGTYYRASGTVLVDGADWKGDNGDDYARVRKLFESTGFHSIKVHANSTKNDGWTSYGVVLFSDGRCRIFSSETDIDLGGRDNGVFESKLQEVLAVEETGIEKEMGK